jgi:uncharacterized RDD family membrane protein YckC
MYCSQCGYDNPPAARNCLNCELDFKSPNHANINGTREKLVYAGFWIRFLANFLDLLLLFTFAVLLLLSIAALIALTGKDSIVHNSIAAPLFYGSIILVSIAYYVLLEGGSRRGTLGKRWLNLKVTDRIGNRLFFMRALWRLTAHLFSYLPFGLGFFIQPFTPRRQTLHDLLAGTIVVREHEGKKIHIAATLLVLFVALLVPVLAFLATAGLPVFQQRIQNVQMDKGFKIGQQATQAVARYYLNYGRIPALVGATGARISSSPHVSGIAINPQNGEVTLTFSDSVRLALRDKHLLFTPAQAPDQSIVWRCHSDDIEARHLPESCR